MDVFNKLKNTLTSTVNEISAALPGNPLLREYEAGSQVGSCGPNYLWKIYSGIKKSTKSPVSIFIFEKKRLEEFPKSQRDRILNILKKGTMQLTKLRHPKILTVEHVMEESRESLVFCTEPVFASLGNALGNFTNILEVPPNLKNHKLYEVEIKFGLLQLSEACSFLHSSVKLVHGNLCPESIIINKDGAWKLSGFDFCITNSNPSGDPQFNCFDWDPTLPSPCLPNPNYLAVEYITKRICDTGSDMFSIGMILYSVYYDSKTLYQCTNSNVNRVFSQNEDKLRHLSVGQLHNIPESTRDHVKMLLHPDSNVRPDADQMTKLPFFEDIGVVTLVYIDSLLQRDNLQKSQFFKNLSPVIEQLPKRVVVQRILPSLMNEFSNPDMVPFVLPNVFVIAESCNKQEFLEIIFPSLIPVFKVQKPVQVLLILLQNMELLLTKTSTDHVRGHILPMLCNALSAPSIQIQELCLTIIPTFAEKLDFSAMKNSVIPRIKLICNEGGTNGVRINALVCLGKILPYFDKWFVMDEILTSLYEVRSREPGILMAILGVFKTAFDHQKLGISKEVMATKAIPFLLPLAIDNNLNIKQFNAYMAVIKEMLQKVEKEQGSKLQQLGKMQVEQASTVDFSKFTSKANNTSTTSAVPKSADDIFTPPPTQKPVTNGTSGTEMSRQHLTLEEKQKLAKAKEQEFMMKKQGPLKPTVQKLPQQKQPVDLTSTLMMSNMNKTNTSSLSTMNQINWANSKTNNQSTFAAKTTPQWGGMGGSTSTNVMSMNFSNGPQNQTPTQPVWQQNNAMNSRTNNTKKQADLSSFDNLLSMPSQTQRVPMASMSISNQKPVQSFGANPIIQPQKSSFNRPILNSNPQFGAPNMSMANPNSTFVAANPFLKPMINTAPMNSNPSMTNNQPTRNLSNNELLDFLN